MATTHEKRIVIYVSVWFVVILCCSLFMGAKAWRQAKTLNLRNATDSLMLLVELKSASGGNYIEAKADYAEILRQYVRHMESRDLYPFLLLPPFSKKNIAKELERVAKDLEKADPLNAREAIEKAPESIAEFLTKSKLFTNEPIDCKPEVISEELQNALKDSFKESHGKVEIYVNDPNMANSEDAYRANRKVIVYLYLARFGYQEIVNQEELKKFRKDLNRTIYYNQALQQTDDVKDGKGVKDSDYELLDRYSDSEIRRLQILQAIIDNDIQQAHVLLQMAVNRGRSPYSILNRPVTAN